MNVGDRQALRGEMIDTVAGDLLCLVGGIVEHLDIEKLARIVEA